MRKKPLTAEQAMPKHQVQLIVQAHCENTSERRLRVIENPNQVSLVQKNLRVLGRSRPCVSLSEAESALYFLMWLQKEVSHRGLTPASHHY